MKIKGEGGAGEMKSQRKEQSRLRGLRSYGFSRLILQRPRRCRTKAIIHPR